MALVNAFGKAIQVDSVEKKWRSDLGLQASFDSKWDVVQTGGPPAVPGVAGGTLVISAGTVANSETTLTSKAMFTIPCRFAVGLALSQRIVNQQFRLELVSCDPTTGTVYPVGDANYHQMGWMLDGATATQGKYEVTNSGILLTSGAVTITTAAATVVFEGMADNDACRFSQRTIDSTAGRVNPFRRDQNLPDPNLTYKLRIRVTNLGTAPASNTTLTLSFAAVMDYNEVVTEISAGQGSNDAGSSVPVNVNSSVAVAISGTPAVTSANMALAAPSTAIATTPAGTLARVQSAATTNATSVKTTVGKLMGIFLTNNAATIRYLKVYNKASAPTVGTDTPIFTFAIPANGVPLSIPFTVAPAFATGLAYAITGAAADADTTAIGANEVTGFLHYV
jgi:hypothetical protein